MSLRQSLSITITFLFLLCSSIAFGQSADVKKLISRIEQETNRQQEGLTRSDNQVETSLYQHNGVLYFDALISYNDSLDIASLEKDGFILNKLTPNVATLKIPIDKADKLKEAKGVQRASASGKVNRTTDNAKEATGVFDIENAVDLPKAFAGTGVIYGIVDIGFQFDHSNFYNHDTGKLRISRVWDQNVSSTQSNTSFRYGYEYVGEEEIVAHSHDVTTDTHGTHVLGIGAGSDFKSGYYGVASDAEIVVVATNMTISCVLDGIKYILDYANEVNKPCVINLSLGTSFGPHDGTSLSNLVIDGLCDTGNIIVCSAGNDGYSKGHIKQTFTPSDDMLRTFITLDKNDNYTTTINMWGDENCSYTNQVYLYDHTNKEVLLATEPFAMQRDSSFVVSWRVRETETSAYSTIAVEVETGISSGNNKPSMILETRSKQINGNRFYVGIDVQGTAGTMHGWVMSGPAFKNLSLATHKAGDSEYTISEMVATAHRSIAVASFNTRNKLDYLDGSSATAAGTGLSKISSFSSYGPTSDERWKPDIAAPGAYLVSSVSGKDETFKPSDYIALTHYNSKENYYAAMQGTSMSSPFVAGVVALMLEVNPTLTPEEIKEILAFTAKKDTYTNSAGIYQAGNGKIDAYAAIKKTLQELPTGINPHYAPKEPFMHAVIDDNLNVVFTAASSSTLLRIYDTEGKCLYEQSLRNTAIGEEVNVPVGGFEKGTKIIEVVTENARSSKKIML